MTKTIEEKAYLLDNDDSWVAQLCREYPKIRNSIISILDNQIGTGHINYVVKFDHPDLQDYFKTGIAKCLKERFNDKRIRIRKIHPNVIEQKTFDFQVVGSREFETMMKRMIPHNIELEKIGVKTEGDYFPGHTEFYTMDKWDEVINLAEQEYPNYKDIVGVKRAK